MKVAFLLGLVAVGLANAKQPPRGPDFRLLCGAHGMCVDSSFVDSKAVHSEIECRQFCSDTTDCLWYTYKPGNPGSCLAFKDCNKLDETVCPDCLSGEKTCKIPNCRQQKCCTGRNIDTPTTETSPGACLERCQNTPNCKYFNYQTEQHLCVLLEDLPDIAGDCTDGPCVSGDVDCPLPKCKVDACCSADPTAYFPVASAIECLQACTAQQPNCSWYTFLISNKFCFLLPDCLSSILEGTGTCESGEVDCPQV